MGVNVACKNKEDPIKNEGARVVTTLFIDFSDAQSLSGGILPNSNSFKLFMVGRVTCKNEEDQSKNEGA